MTPELKDMIERTQLVLELSDEQMSELRQSLA